MEKLQDRITEFPNRRKLKVVRQNVDELIVDVERDEGTVTQEGTQINAKLFNDWDQCVREAYGKVDLLTSSVDSSAAGTVGTPSVTINGGKLKFSNLKGDRGLQGAQGVQGVKGDKGDKGTDGVITSINGQFAFYVHSDGTLRLRYHDGGSVPQFKLDSNGTLKLTI